MTALKVILIVLAAAVPLGIVVLLVVKGRPRAKEKDARTPGQWEPIHDLGTTITHGPGPTDKEKAAKGRP